MRARETRVSQEWGQYRENMPFDLVRDQPLTQLSHLKPTNSGDSSDYNVLKDQIRKPPIQKKVFMSCFGSNVPLLFM